MQTPSLTLLVVVDGFRPDGLAAARCPNLETLRARAAATLHASSVMPSITLPCHMSIFHSVPPTRHGITSNDWTPMARPLPGLADVAHAAGRRNAFLYNWESLRNLSQPRSLDFSYFRHNNKHPDGDQVIAEEAVRYLSGDRPDFAFVYFGVLDNVGHKYGFMSDEYLAYLERVDGAVGTLLDALPDDATVLLTSDHGGHERVHGTDEPEDMTVPWMIAGPGIRRGYEIESPVSLLDTAPTLARVLGIAPDPDWEGRCVEEVFE
jgi:predicted AlkP superfamily pyrophosphatase or phosphodiesterase